MALVRSSEGNDSHDVLTSGEAWHVDGSTVTVAINWSEGRAGGADSEGNIQRGELVITTDVALEVPLAAP